jgi:hypothetical protein
MTAAVDAVATKRFQIQSVSLNPGPSRVQGFPQPDSDLKEQPMARPGPATQGKRNRERMKQEHQQDKQGRREQRKELRKERELLIAQGQDPDLFGIVAGPQPQLTDEEE